MVPWRRLVHIYGGCSEVCEFLGDVAKCGEKTITDGAKCGWDEVKCAWAARKGSLGLAPCIGAVFVLVAGGALCGANGPRVLHGFEGLPNANCNHVAVKTCWFQAPKAEEFVKHAAECMWEPWDCRAGDVKR